MLTHAYDIIIDITIVAPGNGKHIFHGLNYTKKLSTVMTTYKLPVIPDCYNKISMQISTQT